MEDLNVELFAYYPELKTGQMNLTQNTLSVADMALSLYYDESYQNARKKPEANV